jgi:hypothetical protein
MTGPHDHPMLSIPAGVEGDHIHWKVRVRDVLKVNVMWISTFRLRANLSVKPTLQREGLYINLA